MNYLNKLFSIFLLFFLNLIITNKKKFDLINNNSIKLNLKIYNNFVNFSKIFTNKTRICFFWTNFS